MAALKELLAHPGNYGGPRDVSMIKYLVFHYTGNDGIKPPTMQSTSRTMW